MHQDKTVRGEFTLNAHDKSGRLISSVKKENLVVNAGKGVMATLLRLGTTSLVINGIAFGTSGAVANLSDVAITGAFTKALEGSSSPATNQVVFDYVLELAENNGMTIREAGLISDRAGANTLFARIVFDPIIKTNSLRLSGSWKITF